MRYRFKNRGFSSIEILIYIGLIGVFCSFILPILTTTQRINSAILTKSNENKNQEVVVEIIEELIKKGNGEKMIIHNVPIPRNAHIFNYSPDIGDTADGSLGKEFFSSISSTGNVLLVKSFKTNGKRIEKYFTVLQFCKSLTTHSLIIFEGKFQATSIVETDTAVLLNNVTGKFVEDGNGIFITLKILDKTGKERRVLYGYESFCY